MVAQSEIPTDGPRHLHVIQTVGDGNCLCRAGSKGYFNTNEKHVELRVRMIVEGVTNMKNYLSDECLQHGAIHFHGNADLPTVFTTFSEYYTPGQKLTEESITNIYCMEMHSIARLGSYLGLWQLVQLSSVLGIPVHMIYPLRGESFNIRNDFHHMFFPVTSPVVVDNEPLVIMWTGMRRAVVPIHLVPLLKNPE